MAKISELNQKSCSQCGKCCTTHPCALAPSDLGEIADHFDLPEEELFRRYLVLDYLETGDKRQYYVCPARKDGKAGTIVEAGWTFSDSSCIFLNGRTCSIQEVKPKGGKSLLCSLMLNSNRNLVGYGKTNSAVDWNRTDILKVLLNVANEHKEGQKTYSQSSQDLVIALG